MAITNNGATKGGSPEALHTIRTSPGIEDVWQLHYAQNAGKENNAPEPFIVNVDQDAKRELDQALGGIRWRIHRDQ